MEVVMSHRSLLEPIVRPGETAQALVWMRPAAAFARPLAIGLTNPLLDLEPANPYGNLFRGSSRLLKGHNVADGVADLEYAIALAPESPDVRWVVADAYSYGLSDPHRAFAEATFALEGGLDTPRV
jgi:hypothetical protein